MEAFLFRLLNYLKVLLSQISPFINQKQTFMKKILFLFSVVAFTACNEDNVKVESATDTKKNEDVSYAYPINYSSKFETGNPAHAQTILQLWKHWDEGDLSKSRDMFADTIAMFVSNGMTMAGPKDSVIAWTKQYRDMFSKIESKVDAVTFLKSTDKEESWANVWGMEIYTDLAGKTDSVHLHEAWRFDKDGKINLMFQYTRAATPPSKQ